LFTAFIDRADVVVLPYKNATQSGVIQAAFGRNTPVITTDVGGLAEVVENGRNGFIVPDNDPLGLSKTIVGFFTGEKEIICKYNLDNNYFSWHELTKKITNTNSNVTLKNYAVE
jgi:glycosyltransferase involved in cell wall biosynthesis